MSMAEDNTLRSYRSNEPYRRSSEPLGSGQQPAGSDPLAELARLIGQTDPFTDFAPGGQRRGEPRDQQRAAPPPAAADWRKAVAAMPPFEPVAAEEQEPSRHEEPRHEQPHYEDEQPAYHGDSRYAASRSAFDRPDPYQRGAVDEPHADAHADDERFAHRFADEPSFGHAEHGHNQHGDHHDDHHRDGARFAAEPQPQGRPYYEEGAPMGPHDEEIYDDPPRSRGRNGLITAVTLIGCAMLGTAGAYGYRTYYTGAGVPRTPPVITAETTPNKVVASVDTQPTKSIQDRVRDPSGERVVSREEQPVELRNPPATSAPRIVLPAPVAPSQPQTVAPAMPPTTTTTTAPRNGSQPPAATAPTSGGNQQGVAGGEPKRIRTVAIRPDGTDLSGRPVTGSTGGQPSAATPARPAAKSAQPPRNNGGPISLDPQTQPAGSPPPTAAAPAPTPPAPRLASAPSTGDSGGYAVQLSSQRSEAEARSSFRALQGKFPDQLGGRSAMVKRADLGDKGVYYRAMVGGFGSAEEAGRFCGGLKAAGGQCIIQKN